MHTESHLRISWPDLILDSTREVETMQNLADLKERMSGNQAGNHYDKRTELLVQLAIAERLDGILTEMKSWRFLTRVGPDGAPAALVVDVIS